MAHAPANAWSAHQLAEFVAGITEQPDLDHAVNRALDHLCETFDAELAAVGQGDELLGSTGFGRDTAPLATAYRGIVAGVVDVLDLPGAGRCHLSVSTHTAEGVGCHLIVGRTAPAGLAPDEFTLLRNMARVLGMSLRTFRLLESLRERQRLLERLSVIQRSIARRAGLESVLSAIIDGVVELLDADSALIRLFNERGPSVVASHGVEPEVLAQIERTPFDGSISDRAAHAGTIVTEARSKALATVDLHRPGIVMAAPILDAGRSVGAVAVATHDPDRREFTAGEREALALFAEHASIALTDARSVQAVELAMYDPLTQLPNRVLFSDRLVQARSSYGPDRMAGVLFIDLDGFKAVNDTLGHAAGDELLADLATRLTWLVRPGDLIARHGGDEFTVLLQDLDEAAEAEVVANRILAGLREPFTVAGTSMSIGASIGIALDDGDPLADLVERADLAMYTAKQRGRGRFAMYGGEMPARTVHLWAPTL